MLEYMCRRSFDVPSVPPIRAESPPRAFLSRLHGKIYLDYGNPSIHLPSSSHAAFLRIVCLPEIP